MTIEEKIANLQLANKKLKRIKDYIYNAIDSDNLVALEQCTVNADERGMGYVMFQAEYNTAVMQFDLVLGAGRGNAVLTKLKITNIDANSFEVNTNADADDSNVELEFYGDWERQVLAVSFFVIGRVLKIWGDYNDA